MLYLSTRSYSCAGLGEPPLLSMQGHFVQISQGFSNSTVTRRHSSDTKRPYPSMEGCLRVLRTPTQGPQPSFKQLGN
eukprot:3189941-Rhodomonas_salina.2